MDLINNVKDWIHDRFQERTSWDGLVIIGVSVAALILGPIIKWIALAGIVYGIWTFVKEEGLI